MKIEPAGPCGMRPIHPGILIADELSEMNLTMAEAADRLQIDTEGLQAVLAGCAPITAELAGSLGQFFGNGARIWLALQENFDKRNMLK